MQEKPDTVHGRLLEGAHLSGYSIGRMISSLKWLLEDDRWKECGDGYEDIDDFLSTIDLHEFKLRVDDRKDISRMLADKRASQRKIADALGVTHTTVQRDIGTNVPEQDTEAQPTSSDVKSYAYAKKTSGTNVPPETPPSLSTSGERSWEVAAKQTDKQWKKEREYNHIEGDEWYTPRWLFDALGLQFSIDVCAPIDKTHVTTPADLFYDQEADGLVSEWRGTIWCNPPYSDPSPWAEKCVSHGDGLLLTHIPMNAKWCVDVWHNCDGIRLFQAIEFVRPDGTRQRPGQWLQLAAFGPVATEALRNMTVPDDVAENPRRVPSPMWRRET